MKKLNQSGVFDTWILLFIVVLLLFLGSASFAVWAYSGRQDYKNNVDKKIAAAVTIAKQQEDTAKDKDFVEKEKQPLKQYQGPATYGSITVQYPKTWSGFVTESTSDSNPINGYFHPNVVPGLQSGTAFALRIVVTSQSYGDTMKSFADNAQSGKVTVSAFRAAKVPSVLGSRIDGEINTGQKDSMVVFPLRDKTLEISTESAQFLNDFNTYILPGLTFSP